MNTLLEENSHVETVGGSTNENTQRDNHKCLDTLHQILGGGAYYVIRTLPLEVASDTCRHVVLWDVTCPYVDVGQ